MTQDTTEIRRILSLIVWVLTCVVLGGCGNSSPPAPAAITPAGTAPDDGTVTPPPDTDVVDTFAFVDSGRYAEVLVACSYAQGVWLGSCTHEELPYIGQETDNPSLDDVLERVVVSHEWMGENFRDVMAMMPADTLLLFRSVKAIVIADDIRPAGFNLGNIYLDPEFLWLTPEQRDTIANKGDFRADYGADLQFRFLGRYIRDGEPLGIRDYAAEIRELDELPPILGRILFHELAHAVDQMQPERLPTLEAREAALWGPYLSYDWITAYPLHMGITAESRLLEALAEVLYTGEPAQPSHKSVQPAHIAEPFAAGGAVMFYAYVSQFEDFALAFEAAMMSYHFGYDLQIAVTGNLTETEGAAIVHWGQTGRLGEQRVFQRVLGAVQAMYPGELSALETHLASLPPPMPLLPGCAWRDYIAADAPECM